MVISLIIIPRTAQAASVKLNKTKLTMNVGGVYHLKVSGTNKKVTWSSTDSKVASVSSGKVKAKKTGTATITAKIGSKKLKCQIKIKDQRALYEKVLLQSGGKCFYLMDIDRLFCIYHKKWQSNLCRSVFRKRDELSNFTV